MPRYRVEYSKGGPARFISHLDLVRAFERAMRRAGLPLAFSRGFNPHPLISPGPPLPVGVEGEREYLDVELVEELAPGEVRQRLAAELPAGLALKGVWRVPPGAPALMAAVSRASYRVEVPLAKGVMEDEVRRCLQLLLDGQEVVVSRRREGKGEKAVNIRPGIYRLCGRVKGGVLCLEMTLAAGDRLNVRPQEVVEALAVACPHLCGGGEPRVVRTGLFPVEAGRP